MPLVENQSNFRKDTLAQKLADVPLFAHMDVTQLNRLLENSTRVRYQAGDWIVHHGDVWDCLFLVLKGDVTVVKESAEGRSLVLETIHQGEVFWGLGFFLDEVPMPAALTAKVDCELLLWCRDDLLPFLLIDGTLSWGLSRYVLKRALRASDIVEELAFQPVAGRLANLILRSYPTAVGAPVSRDLTLEEMAARVGTTREVVCRLLYRFAESGAVHINRTEFEITDSNLLEEWSRKGRG